VVTKNGWKDAFGVDASNDSEEGEGDGEDAGSQSLPSMKTGDQTACLKAMRRDSKTKPPARFTEGSLTQAMENIHKYVDDKEHKKCSATVTALAPQLLALQSSKN
jgi:DNA topoisomerase-3